MPPPPPPPKSEGLVRQESPPGPSAGNYMAGDSQQQAQAVPVIDLQRLADGTEAGVAAIAAQIRAACTETGFFYITNHGIAEELCVAAFESTRRYFSLSAEARDEHERDEQYKRGLQPVRFRLTAVFRRFCG